MKYLAAYLLLTKSGKEATAESITEVLSSVGIEVDASRVEALLKSVEGKTVDELVAEGNSKLASVPVGGAAAASSGAAAGASSEAAAEEKEESAAEESDDDMGFGLFD
ncbi:hypothetical protein ACO0SA_001958 [Hanseniaspora valbyensis]|uniref:Ribosomal protein 60S n=1 Tax=Hanseniaspora valbyensis NRRL Y-1626 TaxID=766949 RepID=A0A1B7TGH6_9ASCO|nr:ribosomal protein 60S [Hanseniaspora valbyensis NRRL Y-1626]